MTDARIDVSPLECLALQRAIVLYLSGIQDMSTFLQMGYLRQLEAQMLKDAADLISRRANQGVRSCKSTITLRLSMAHAHAVLRLLKSCEFPETQEIMWKLERVSFLETSLKNIKL